MKITIWGINYAPEPTGIGPYTADLAEYFRDRGHDVRAVTSFPYYPDWKKKAFDRNRLFRREDKNGVKVFRCWHYVPETPTAGKRILHEASFIWTSFWRLLFTPRPDLVLVISPPLLLGASAWLIGLLKRCPFHFHVQDMQPDAAIALGLLRPGRLTSILYRFEKFACRKAATVSGITSGMLKMFEGKGVPARKQYLLPNWILDRKAEPTSEPVAPGTFRKAHQIPPRDFLVVYSGNLGKKQGLDVILDAAIQLSSGEGPGSMLILIAGEGSAKAHLQSRIENERLPVRLLPLQSSEMFQAMLHDADLCLVTQQKGAGALFFPSKIITLLSAGKPVLTVADADSELAKATEKGRFGQNVLPGDASELARAISHLAQNPDRLPILAENGRNWIKKFSRQTVLGQFAQHLETGFNGPKATVETLTHEPKQEPNTGLH